MKRILSVISDYYFFKFRMNNIYFSVVMFVLLCFNPNL